MDCSCLKNTCFLKEITERSVCKGVYWKYSNTLLILILVVNEGIFASTVSTLCVLKNSVLKWSFRRRDDPMILPSKAFYQYRDDFFFLMWVFIFFIFSLGLLAQLQLVRTPIRIQYLKLFFFYIEKSDMCIKIIILLVPGRSLTPRPVVHGGIWRTMRCRLCIDCHGTGSTHTH